MNRWRSTNCKLRVEGDRDYRLERRDEPHFGSKQDSKRFSTRENSQQRLGRDEVRRKWSISRFRRARAQTKRRKSESFTSKRKSLRKTLSRNSSRPEEKFLLSFWKRRSVFVKENVSSARSAKLSSTFDANRANSSRTSDSSGALNSEISSQRVSTRKSFQSVSSNGKTRRFLCFAFFFSTNFIFFKEKFSSQLKSIFLFFSGVFSWTNVESIRFGFLSTNRIVFTRIKFVFKRHRLPQQFNSFCRFGGKFLTKIYSNFHRKTFLELFSHFFEQRKFSSSWARRKIVFANDSQKENFRQDDFRCRSNLSRWENWFFSNFPKFNRKIAFCFSRPAHCVNYRTEFSAIREKAKCFFKVNPKFSTWRVFSFEQTGIFVEERHHKFFNSRNVTKRNFQLVLRVFI